MPFQLKASEDIDDGDLDAVAGDSKYGGIIDEVGIWLIPEYWDND